MGRHTHLTGRFGRSRRGRRKVLVGFLLLAAALGGVFYYLTRPERLAQIASSLLTDLTGARVRILSARLGLDGGIQLRGVELSVPGNHPDADRLFTADRVVIHHDLRSLLTGQFRATSLLLVDPIVYLTEDAESEVFNFQRLPRKPSPPNANAETELPEIIVRGGALRRGEVENGRYTDMGVIHASGRLAPQPGKPGLYFFTLRQEHDGPQAGPVINGTFDLDKRIVAGKLERFTFENPQRGVLPHRLRQWWDNFEPAGAMPTVSFGYDPDPKIGFHVTLEAKDVELTPPPGFLNTRLTHVSGRFTLARDAATGQDIVTVANLTGKADDLTFHVNGQFDGLSQQAPLNLSIRIDPLVVPDDPAYIQRVAPKFAKLLDQFPGTGTLKAMVHVERKETGGALSFDGNLQIYNAEGHYAKFVYPLRNISGELQFSNDLVKVVTINGQGLHGGRVSITGTVAQPGDGAVVNLEVQALDMPVDELMRQALNDKQRAALDMFMDATPNQRLIEQGIIQTTPQKQARQTRLENLQAQRRKLEGDAPGAPETARQLDEQIAAVSAELQRPVFDLGGKANVVAVVTRLGKGQKFTSRITLESAGFNMLFTHWPYPMRLTGGRVIIDPPTILCEGVEAQGLTGGRGRLNGKIDLSDHDVTPQLQVVAAGIPMDAILVASIPKPQDRWVRNLRIDGAIDAAGVIYRQDEGPIEFKIDTQINGGKAQPFGGRFVLNDLAGAITIERGRVSFDSLSATHGPMKMLLSGNTQWTDDQPRLTLVCKASEVNLADPILDLLPPDEPASEKAKQFYAEYKPGGILDADLRYATDPAGKAQFDMDLRPRTLSFDLRGQRIELRDIAGKLTARTASIRFDNWTAAFGAAGHLKISGDIQTGDTPEIDVTFDARDVEFGPVTRAATPKSVIKVLDGLEFWGGYELKNAHLLYRPRSGGQNVLDFRGRLRLTDAVATLGVPIDQLTGDLDFQTQFVPDSEWPRIDLRLDALRLTAADRLISPLSVHIASAEDLHTLEIKELHGSVYGGTLLGSGTIDLSRASHYRLALTLQDALLDPVLYPEQYPKLAPFHVNQLPQTRPSSSPVPTGILSANLDIEGTPDNSTQRSGRGKLEIRNANLYEVPLAMGLLQILNLSLPTAKAFDRAAVSYLLYGDTVKFDSIALVAPTVEIVGSGQMQYSTRKLDLNLTSRNAGGIGLGPISDMLRGIKDELVAIHVTGTLTQPKTELRSFSGVKDSWEQVFGRPATRSPQTLPAPASGSGPGSVPAQTPGASPAPLIAPEPLGAAPATSGQ